MASIIDELKEEARKSATGDTNYAKKGYYVFVLRGPTSVSPLGLGKGYAQFPLPINPDSFEYVLPFAATVTALQEGGVVADENGIVIGNLSLQGTTGFRVRVPYGDTSFDAGNGEFTSLLDSISSGEEIASKKLGVSGQMAFWRLAGRCFDGYSALKKDPNHAPKTRMEFHSTKDELHLAVVPREFKLSRSAGSERVTYRYSIRCDVVGMASETVLSIPGPDVSLLQNIKNTIAKIRNTIQSVSAAISDLRAAIDDIRRTITGIAGLIDDVAGIIDAATDLVEGTKKFLDIPAAFINATAGVAESMAAHAASIDSYPAATAQAFRNISDGLDRLSVAGRKHFRENFDETSRRYDSATSDSQNGLDPDRDAQAEAIRDTAGSAQGRMSAAQVFGGAVQPGDTERGEADPIRSQTRFRPGKFSGFKEVAVAHGDTLQNLAARHLGNAREWPAIAMANQLKAPYITDGAKMPGTIQLGGKIIIPVTETQNLPDTLTAGDPLLGRSQAEEFWGTDHELVRLGDGTIGWEIDTVDGSTDARHVRGLGNLSQALGNRAETEQGDNILYPNFGFPRLVGQNGLGDVLPNARYEAQQQLLADPRIVSVSSLSVRRNRDVFTLEIAVKPIGELSNRVISRTLT